MGGTVLGLVVAPIAIEQYPEIFKESPWILPLGIVFVCACWLIPLLFHDRARRLHRWTINGLGRNWGWAAILGMIILASGLMYVGGTGLYSRHKRHLEARLSKEIPVSNIASLSNQAPQIQKPEAPSLVLVPPPPQRTDEASKKHPTDSPPKKTQGVTREEPIPIIQTAPTFGNLAERAMSLSEEIMNDLYLHGWRNHGQQGIVVQQMPTKPEEIEAWTRSRSSYFRFRFFERVLDMRNEFAELHLRDEQLDDFFKYQGMIEQANKQMIAANPGARTDIPTLPQQIEEVAERLKVLASQIPIPRADPRPLNFSVARIQPEKPEFSFEVVVTIDTSTDITAGYVVVEFEGLRAFTGTDFADSKLIFFNDESILGNKPLKAYLKVHSFDTYALEVGKTPFTPKKPIHVVAGGAAPFSVTKVTLFDR